MTFFCLINVYVCLWFVGIPQITCAQCRNYCSNINYVQTINVKILMATTQCILNIMGPRERLNFVNVIFKQYFQIKFKVLSVRYGFVERINTFPSLSLKYTISYLSTLHLTHLANMLHISLQYVKLITDYNFLSQILQ